MFCSMAEQEDFGTARKPVKVFPRLPSIALTTQICACPQTELVPSCAVLLDYCSSLAFPFVFSFSSHSHYLFLSQPQASVPP